MPKIDSIYDFTDKAKVELKAWLEPWLLTRIPKRGRIDSTENVGTADGVQSIESDGTLEADALVLTTDGDGGSTWAPALTSSFASFTAFVLAQPSLWAYWPLNDASGNPVDIFGGRALTKHGSAFTYQVAGPFDDQPLLSGLDLSGSTAWLSYSLTAPEQALWVSTLPWTWMGWVYRTGDGSSGATTMFSLHNLAGGAGAAASASYVLSANDHVQLQRDPDTSDSGVAMTNNLWHNVAVTYSGSGTGAMILYLDGVQIATLTNVQPNPVLQVRLGAQGNVGVESNFWVGRLAQVAMFTSVISPTDIAGAADLIATTAPAGQVPTADGTGGYTWDYPTISVTF